MNSYNIVNLINLVNLVNLVNQSILHDCWIANIDLIDLD